MVPLFWGVPNGKGPWPPACPEGPKKWTFPENHAQGVCIFLSHPSGLPVVPPYWGGSLVGVWLTPLKGAVISWFALGPSEYPKTRLGESRNPAFEATKMGLEGIGNRGVGSLCLFPSCYVNDPPTRGHQEVLTGVKPDGNPSGGRLCMQPPCHPKARSEPPLGALITALYCLSCGASQGDPAVQFTCPSGHLLMVSWVVCFTSISPRRVPDWSDPHGNPCQSQCTPLLWVTVECQ